MKYKLISKTLFLEESGTLIIGDLHLGYEQMLKQQGIAFPVNQLEQTKKEIAKVIQELGKENIKKIILLGDLKHYFSFDKSEKFIVRDFLEFLEEFVPPKKIILIKGNHEKFELDKRKYYDFYIQDKIIFTHGHKDFPKLWDKKIKTIIMSHIHPAVTLKEAVKKEKFKAHLMGRYKKKNIFILPSFFPLVSGTEITDLKKTKTFGIIPNTKLKNFDVYLVGENDVNGFGKLKDLN
jgi:uncharacterized protein